MVFNFIFLGELWLKTKERPWQCTICILILGRELDADLVDDYVDDLVVGPNLNEQ
jgi:hypothetical protein